MLLRIKDIREVLEKTLSMFYSAVDYSIRPTRVMNKTKDFRIEFRIYDAEFWMDIDLAIDSIHIGTRSFGDVDHIDSLQMWLSKPYEYKTDKFEFAWRKDLEYFFDGLQAYLVERVERTHNAPATKDDEAKKEKSVIAQCIDAVYGSAKVDESKVGECKIAGKPSIFNSIDTDENRDEYI